jgi:hypothetical protein
VHFPDAFCVLSVLQACPDAWHLLGLLAGGIEVLSTWRQYFEPQFSIRG